MLARCGAALAMRSKTRPRRPVGVAISWTNAGNVGGLLLGSIPARALEFLILTAARIDEVRGAKWNGPIPVLMRAWDEWADFCVSGKKSFAFGARRFNTHPPLPP